MKTLADGRWFDLSLLEQLANVGCDVDRAIRWKQRNNSIYSQDALDRAFNLLNLTIQDFKNRKRLRELGRMREVLKDYFIGDNNYGYTDEALQKYFMDYNYLAAVQKGK
jgi:hypothetical protein